MDNRKRPYKNTAPKSDRKGRTDTKNPKYNRYEERSAEEIPESVIVGRNAVRELLKTDRTVDKLFVQRGEREGSIVVIVAEAIEKKIPIVEVDKARLDKMSGGAHHQGVLAMAAEKEYSTVDDILEIKTFYSIKNRDFP